MAYLPKNFVFCLKKNCYSSKLIIDFYQAVIDGLRRKNHDTTVSGLPVSVVQAIVVNKDGTIDAACDSRRGGIPDGY